LSYARLAGIWAAAAQWIASSASGSATVSQWHLAT
jgi:hypothetical protein